MISLRRRLFALLLAATGVIWLSAVIWIYLGSRAELKHVFDARVREAARMVHSLVASGNMATAIAATPFEGTSYARQLSCQIWSFDGRLVARSTGAPDESLAQDKEGFAERQLNGEAWRVYTIVDAAKGLRVVVGDRIGLRDRLVRDLVAGLITPALLIVPLLAIMIWVSLGRGLRPLNAIAGEIAARDGEDMRPIDSEDAPTEVHPLLSALNGLFDKVEAARRHEREITAFAAHELRTPLAGLKTQAQVALAATEVPVREGALNKILVSVERTTRLTRQLLALAKLEATPERKTDSKASVGAVLREVVSSTPIPEGIAVEFDPAIDQLPLSGDRENLHLVLRNLHENAVQHMPKGGRVVWKGLSNGTGIIVEDDGPGIPDEELAVVARRFFRGRNRSAFGTGLGLTIAEMAADRLGTRLTFENRPDRQGLRCSVIWPQTDQGCVGA